MYAGFALDLNPRHTDSQGRLRMTKLAEAACGHVVDSRISNTAR
jgi:hypothetical protein